VWPLKYVVRPYELGPDFVTKATIGIFQYAFVSIFLFLMNCLLWRPPWDKREPWFRETHTYIELATKITKSISCGWAMYNLVMFYHKVQPLLKNFKPLLKFMSIKGIIFFTFWQGIVFFFLGHLGVIPDKMEDSAGEVWHRPKIAKGLLHFLVCLEMPIFAFMHRCAYPVPTDEMNQVFKSEGEDDNCTLYRLFQEIRTLRKTVKAATWEGQRRPATDIVLNTIVGRGQQQQPSVSTHPSASMPPAREAQPRQ